MLNKPVTAWWILHKLKVNMIWKEEVDIRPLDSILHETRTFEERASEYLEIFGPEEKDIVEATKDKIYKFAVRFKPSWCLSFTEKYRTLLLCV